MKNEKLKGLLKTVKINENVDFELLNPSEEGELKGGLACFTCANFKCKPSFAAS